MQEVFVSIEKLCEGCGLMERYLYNVLEEKREEEEAVVQYDSKLKFI